MNDRQLNFVVRYYRYGALDANKAYRTTLERAERG